MKKTISFLLAVLMLVSVAACGKTDKDNQSKTPTPANPLVRVCTTSAVSDTGLLSFLFAFFEQETGYKVEVGSAVPTALFDKSEGGIADVLLTHTPSLEEEFIKNGFGVQRRPLMYSHYVIVGPKDDPAEISGCSSAAEAFAKIRAAQAAFVSRGDNSSTYLAEMEIWGDKAPDAASDTWYVNSGESMSMCLSKASKTRAYCLSDNATYLSYRDSLALKPLLENGEDMQDVYSLIDVNPKKVDGVNSEGAKALIEWMFGEEASNLIARYGETTYGAPLYTLVGQ